MHKILYVMLALVLLLGSIPITVSDNEQNNGTFDTQAILTLRPDGDLDGFMIWSPLAPIYNYDEIYETGSHDGFSSYVYTDVAEFYNYDFYTVENHTDETEVIESVTLRGVFNDDTPDYADSAVCLSIGNGTTGRLPDIVASDSLVLEANGWGELEWTFDSDPYGYPWTWDMIDQMLIGINVTYLGTATEVYCTQLWAEVNYSETEEEEQWPDAKMHYPQLPDPNGWDVLDYYIHGEDENEYWTVLADDWMCTETGNVTGIHWWGSWKENQIGLLNGFDVAIFSDIPDPDEEGPLYSMPGASLWHQYVSIQQLNITEEEPSLQGWYDPYPSDPSIIEDDHTLYFRYDFENITEPFYQENGTIYWLSVVANISGGEGHGEWGWKTSVSPQWNDGCVGVFEAWEPPHDWINISEPYTDEKLDLAFVITGETVEPEPEPAIFYVDQQYNASTPGWHVTHWNTIHEAVENASAGHTVLVNGDGDIYNENVVIDAKSIDVFGNYTTSRPRINGQSATKSTVAIMSDWVNFSGFYVYNNIGMVTYHGISVGFISGRLESYFNVTISDCYITNAAAGVLLRSGGDCIVQTSEFPTTLVTGVQISAGGLRNIVRNCSMHNIQKGIDIQSLSAYTQIYGNVIYSTTTSGLYINGHTTNGQTIYENNFTSNLVGIDVASGRTNNLIYHNNFASNTNHVTFVNNANLNFWNLSYPYCGNYWSGHGTQDIYGGSDQDVAGSDLICDLHSPDPYTVGGVNIDNYPFLNPYNGTIPTWNLMPVIYDEDPLNNSIDIDVNLLQVDVTVEDPEGDLFNVTLHGLYLNTTNYNNVGNGTYSADINGILPYYTDIVWYVNVSGVGSTGIWTNETFVFETIRPSIEVQPPSDFTAITLTDTQINLTWTVPINGSNVYVEMSNVSYLLNRGDGTFVCNTTETYFKVIDLLPVTQYYFTAWGYNTTYDIWSNSSINATNITMDPPPSVDLIFPLNQTDYLSVYNEIFNCTVSDSGLEELTIEFHINDTITERIGYVNTTSRGEIEFQLDSFGGTWWLTHSTEYSWYVIADDGLERTQSETWTFITSEPSDINEDRHVDYLDVSLLVNHYSELVTPPGRMGWDINNDGLTNYLDVSSLVSHY